MASSSPVGACAQDRPELVDICFLQEELDKASKDKKHFPPGFKVPYLVHFTDLATHPIPLELTQSLLEEDLISPFPMQPLF